jgi:molybdopterin/thiamine biosynthesis adenylyltransferase
MYERQSLLIPEAMQRATVVVVGCGMLGSWTVQSLVRTVRTVIAYDMDEVGPENIGTQSYDFMLIGMNKAQALSMSLQGFRNYLGIPERLTEDDLNLGLEVDAIVSAVDSFEARRMVAAHAERLGAVFIDTRAHGTVGVVLCVKPSDIPSYLATLESDDTAPEPLCGAEGTGFNGLWVASQVTSSLVRHFRGLPVPFKVVHDVGMDLRLMTQMTPSGEGVVLGV